MPNYKLFLLLILSTIYGKVSAQELFYRQGLTWSTFEYRNSAAQILSDLQPVTRNTMAIGYRQLLFEKRIYLFGSVNYDGYGATGNVGTQNNLIRWNLDYLGIEAGLDLTLIHLKNASFYLKASGSAATLLSGSQLFNNELFDLKNQEDFEEKLIHWSGGFGISYRITNELSAFSEYRQGRSNSLINPSNYPADKEQLKIFSQQISIGLRIKTAQR